MKAGSILRRVEISPSFLIVLCAYYYFDPGGTFYPFVYAACSHELGHLLVLKLLNVPVHKLYLAAGGACLVTAPTGYKKEILVAAVGPFTNLLLSLLFLHRQPMFSLMNLGLMMYNLLPFYPLDGGRLLRCVLQLLFKEYDLAIAIERIICICGLTLFWGLGIWLTCFLHEGLWPAVLCGLLTLRITTTVFPVKLIFPNKRVDKSVHPC